MSSIIRTGGSNIDRSAELRGLSTDTKPTRANGNEVPHGSTWYNMDDSTKYMYNADNDTWYNIPNGGGGGTGDMQKSVYDPTNTVANAGGIDTYVGTEISDATTEIINTVNSNIGTTSDNLIKDTVGWTNKNLLPITLSSLQEINTNGTWDDNVYTYRNITITVETDIYNLITDIKVNGANTTGSVAFKLTNNFVYQLLSEDKYYISDGVDITAIVDGSAYISVERKKGESGETHYLSTNNENRSTKFTVDYATYDYYAVSIYIPNNSSINNAIFYPMIRRASISDATYEPYRSTVEDELNGIDSAIGTLNANLGIANSRITNLQNNKANISDLGTSAYKNSTSVVTDSTDLVESGAVYTALQADLKNTDAVVESTVGWTGKNLCVFDLDKIKSINTSGTWSGNVYTRHTATFTFNADGTITVNGTPSSNAIVYISRYTNYNNEFKNMLLSGCPNGGNDSTYYLGFRPYPHNASEETVCAGSDAIIKNISASIADVVIKVSQGVTVSNITFKPMIRYADVIDSTYEPYHPTVDEQKCDNSVIAPVENGSTASQAYAVGSHAIRNGAFITWKNAKAQGESINDASDYTSGDVADSLLRLLPIFNNAGSHNGIFRGKNLGSSLTAAQKTAIANGSFEDLYIGDYWEINSVKYRIAHFDYWLNCGDGSNVCTDHHVVVVPDNALVNKKMNAKVDNVDTTAGAYVNSEMRRTNLADAKTIVNAAFGADNILGHREYMQNAVTDGYESAGAWVNADIELMSEIMVYGSNIFHNVKCGTALPNLYTVNKTQLALFRLDPSYIICKNVAQTDRSHWWLRDVVSATYFAFVNDGGGANGYGASNSIGVRPAFGIK